MKASGWVLSKWIKQLVRIVLDRYFMESWPDIDGNGTCLGPRSRIQRLYH